MLRGIAVGLDQADLPGDLVIAGVEIVLEVSVDLLREISEIGPDV
jgi:hypothetical protein